MQLDFAELEGLEAGLEGGEQFLVGCVVVDGAPPWTA